MNEHILIENQAARIAELEDLGWRLYSAIITDSVHDGLPREIKDILEKK